MDIPRYLFTKGDEVVITDKCPHKEFVGDLLLITENVKWGDTYSNVTILKTTHNTVGRQGVIKTAEIAIAFKRNKDAKQFLKAR